MYISNGIKISITKFITHEIKAINLTNRLTSFAQTYYIKYPEYIVMSIISIIVKIYIFSKKIIILFYSFIKKYKFELDVANITTTNRWGI